MRKRRYIRRRLSWILLNKDKYEQFKKDGDNVGRVERRFQQSLG